MDTKKENWEDTIWSKLGVDPERYKTVNDEAMEIISKIDGDYFRASEFVTSLFANAELDEIEKITIALLVGSEMENNKRKIKK